VILNTLTTVLRTAATVLRTTGPVLNPTAAINATTAARTTAAVHYTACNSHCYSSVTAALSKQIILFCTSRELPYHIACVKKK